MLDAYELAITIGSHARDWVSTDDEGGFSIDVATLTKLIKQYVEISEIYDDKV